jgi:hypothetical protein
MKVISVLVVLVSFCTSCLGQVVATHNGASDPVTEGWTKFRPFLNVGTFPVVNDLGSGVNSWGIDDSLGFGPPGHDGVYGVVLTPTQLLQLSQGWKYSVGLRIADGNIGVARDSITAFIADGSDTYAMQFGQAENGNPLVMLTTDEDVGITFEVDDTTGDYHLY